MRFDGAVWMLRVFVSNIEQRGPAIGANRRMQPCKLVVGQITLEVLVYENLFAGLEVLNQFLPQELEATANLLRHTLLVDLGHLNE